MRHAARLIVVRHGETLWNRERRMQGHADSPLSAAGELQARRLAERLRAEPFSALYSSDSGRAHATARTVAAATGHPVIADARLRERNFGVFEGLTGPEIAQRHPEAYARFKNRDPDYVIPGGESAVQFHARALDCLQEIATRHAGETATVITHGLVLAILYRLAHDIAFSEPRLFELVNAGINRVRYDAGTWQVEAWADASHLEGLQTSA